MKISYRLIRHARSGAKVSGKERSFLSMCGNVRARVYGDSAYLCDAIFPPIRCVIDFHTFVHVYARCTE